MNSKKVTRKQQVINRLSSPMGEWVPGYELATREVGGSEGLRRLRYAEQDGWIIEKRRVPGETYWEYRLLGHRDDS